MRKRILGVIAKLACLQNIFKREYILLIDNNHNDNAELVDNLALFEYLQSKSEYKDRSFYIINRRNVQYNSIKNKYKNIIPIKNKKASLRLVLMLFKAKYWLDSFQVINFFDVNLKKYLASSKIITVYMQHGITFFKTGFVGWDAITDKVFKKIVVSNEMERDLFRSHSHYDDRNIVYAGLSRWDMNRKQINQADKSIFCYFTFRMYLRQHELKLEMTNYYKNIYNFLKSKRLQKILKEHNIKLFVGMHHEVRNHGKFDIPNIELIDDKDIGKIKQNADMLITDFSSMCFDFMFNDKPVAFYRVDYNDPLLAIDKVGRENNANVESKNNLLYNICYSPEQCIDIVENYCNNNFVLEPEYKKKNEKFFVYRDNVRGHLIENIISSPEGIQNNAQKLPSENVTLNKKYIFTEHKPFSTDGINIANNWSNAKQSIIYFSAEDELPTKVEIEIVPLINRKFPQQSIKVFYNNSYVTTFCYKFKKTPEVTKMLIELPRTKNCSKIQELRFEYSNLIYSRKLDVCKKYKEKIAIKFNSIQFD